MFLSVDELLILTLPITIDVTIRGIELKMLLDTAFSVDSLWESDRQSRKNITFKFEVQNYELNKLREINDFRNRYAKGEFQFTPKKAFRLKERGHERYIQPVAYKDRIVIHSFCQNVLIKELRKYLIHDNCASLKGMGIDQQIKRFEVFLRKYYQRYGTNEGYVLHIDFQKYFDNLRHDKIIELISEKIQDEECIDFLRYILKKNEVDVSFLSDEQYAQCMDMVFNSLKYQQMQFDKTGEKMMPKSVGIGNEVSQIIGVFYPYKIDNYVKIVKGMKYYGRYMDDSIVVHNDRQELECLLEEIRVIAKDLGIFISEKKTYIQKLTKPVLFLKTKFVLTETGKVIKWKCHDTFIRERRKLKKLQEKMVNGEIPYKDIENQYRSWRGTVTRKGYKNYRQVHRMDILYNELFIKPFIRGDYARC